MSVEKLLIHLSITNKTTQFSGCKNRMSDLAFLTVSIKFFNLVNLILTCFKNENLAVKSSTNMNLSPTPKEKRPFTFFRSRTLSSSSTESTGGGGSGGGGGGGGGSTGGGNVSPRISPRSIFDKVVRKRSQSDVKSSSSVEPISNLNQFQHNLQQHLQQQLLQQQLLQQKMGSSEPAKQQQQQQKRINGQVVTVNRKHLSHSISEEKDEEYNEPSYIESNYKTFHGVTGNRVRSPSIVCSPFAQNQVIQFINCYYVRGLFNK